MIADMYVCKLLRQNIEKYRSLFPHAAAGIRLNVTGVIANRGEGIQYVHTDSNHIDPLQRITPAKLVTSQKYDREKYLEMLLDSAESVLSIFGFSRSLFGFEKRKIITGGLGFIVRVREILSQQKQIYQTEAAK